MPVPSLKKEVLEQIVLNKCKSFINMGVWPAGNEIMPDKWLKNFKESEKEHALYLLDSFCYFNKNICTSIIKSSLTQLSLETIITDSIYEKRKEFAKILNKTIFVPATGEYPNVTDSGPIIASYIRRNLDIPDGQFITTSQLYGKALKSVIETMDRIIFIDDLIGSGNQVNTMFTQEFELDTNLEIPIGEKCKELKLKPYFCGIIATQDGIENVRKTSKNLNILVSHVLKKSSSVFSEQSSVWPSNLKTSAQDFLFSTSKRAGIPDNEVKGYDDLGLNIAFELTIPDATIPLFRWNQNNWNALMTKK